MKFYDGLRAYKDRHQPSITVYMELYDSIYDRWTECQVIDGVLVTRVDEKDQIIRVKDKGGIYYSLPIEDRFLRIRRVELSWVFNDGYWGETPDEYGVPYGGPPANVTEWHTIYRDEQGQWRLDYQNSRTTSRLTR